ncbi:type IA DNA topoisomerase [Paenibacillus beijingensis]|uniref:DNA topoisomerase n=1 Tax=Paenibacillus beijingensis TaxID=1126833 RepID=A0A0D5NSU9_9BACL|nr:type IA DNA topoisomerase [Paenibacillus beijingensis]AJY77988.1 DNA topoisomerase III [Paenibacillus beijingensis]
MKTLIIAEKPDMGRTIAAVVEPKAVNRRTYLEGERYIVTWAIGHLVGLAEPDSYDAKYKRWNEHDLPIIPDRFKLKPNPRTKDQLKTIGELAKRCGRLVNACDAGREGQLIFHLIRTYLKLNQPAQRLWISDLTAETIRKGFDNLRSDNDYDDLTRAASARSEADWLIGMNASRAFTIRHRALLSVGRVQTPVLALLYDRYRELSDFKPETYYVVSAVMEQLSSSYRGVWQGERLTDKGKAEAIAAKVKGKPGRIQSYDVTESKEYPYRLYDLTLLQREANGKYGFSAKKTLDLAQALYEKHKVISYPRTNSNYVTEENLPVMGKVLSMLGGTSYADLVQGADRSRVHKGNKAVCNPSKVEDHHAILPTPKKAPILSADENKIYDMIVRRFLSHYYPPAIYNNHTVMTEVEQELFRTRIKQQLAPGWKVTQAAGAEDNKKSSKKKGKADSEEDDEQLTDSAFAVDPALPVQCTDSVAQEKATQPPKSYTEGTLLKAMESAGKTMEDEELRETMKDSGLGTPATRAATIERLKQVGYITLSGKKLDITSKGVAAVELIRGAGVELLASPVMTGQWEQRLVQISRGEASDERFMEQVKQFARVIVDKVKQQPPAPPGTFEDEGGTAGRKGRGGAKASRSAAAKRSGSSGRSGTAPSGEAAVPGVPDGESVHSSRSGGTAAAVRTPAAPSSPAKGAAAGLVALEACPRAGCGGSIIEGKRGYGCSRYREGCGFVIWKEQQGKKVSVPMLKSLISKGATSVLTFKNKDGTSYKGKWVLSDRAKGTLSIRSET